MHRELNNREDAVIVFVDDEQPVLSSLKRALRTVQCEKHFIDSPEKALNLLSSKEVDIVVSDMRMPEMNGADFLARIAELYPDTVRLAFSGYSDNDIVEKVFNEGGIWGYLTKPWDNDELIATMHHILDSLIEDA